IQIDMEDYSLKDLTFDIFRRIGEDPEFKDYPNLGIVLQAYLRSAEEDARKLIEWAKGRGTPVKVRLVKGAYWDYETVHARLEGWPVPVWERKYESDASYERVTRLFLGNHDAVRLAVASHNIRSIAHAMALSEAMGLPPRSVEFQVLYGMATPLRRALVDMGQRVRVYTPYGELIPGMAYLVRRLLENTSNQSFLLLGSAQAESPVKPRPTRARAAGVARYDARPAADAAADAAAAAAAGALAVTGTKVAQVGSAGPVISAVAPKVEEPRA